MRFERQLWNAIEARLEIVVAGVPQGGLAPLMAIQRQSDGFYLDIGAGVWAAAFAANAMTAPDPINLLGYYTRAVPVAFLDYRESEYLIQMREAVTPIVEYVRIAPLRLDEPSAHRSLAFTRVSGEPATLSASAADAVGFNFDVAALPAGADSDFEGRTIAVFTTAGRVVLRRIADWDTGINRIVLSSAVGGGIAIGDEAIILDYSASAVSAEAAIAALVGATINDEGGVGAGYAHEAVALHAAGTRFYTSTSPGVARSASFAGRLAVFHRVGGGSSQTELVRIAQIANDGADYFDVLRLDGTAVPAPGFVAGDLLFVLHRNDPTVDEMMEEPMAAHDTDGTFGDGQRRMLGIRQQNTRIVNTAWNAGGLPTTGSVLIYDSSADLAADVDPWPLATGRYNFTATYDGSGRLTAYTSSKVL